MAEKLVLIDGHSILNRAYYGVPTLTNAAGLHTNAIYGFLNIMFKILDEEKPQYLAVAFDVSAPTFRHEIYKEYKGTRKPMDPELREQVPVMKEVLKAMQIPVMEKAGLEADDILGTMAKRAEKAGLEVALVSGDRDLLQIATDHIMIRIPKTKGGKTEIENYYAKDVEAKYQVNPIQFIDLKALMGDTSDNIPGVPKVGEKTATELMVTFGSLDNIYAHVEEVTKKAVKESLIANKELADLSKVLATINIDADIDYALESAKLENLYTQDAYTLFKQLEFKNMLSRFEKSEQIDNAKLEEGFVEITNQDEMKALFAKVKDGGQIAIIPMFEKGAGEAKQAAAQMSLFDEIEENVEAGTAMIAFSISDEETYYIQSKNVDYALLKNAVEDLYRSKAQIITADSKKLYGYLADEIEVKVDEMRSSNAQNAANEIVASIEDVILAAYLLNPLKNDYDLDAIASEHLGLLISSYAQIFGKEKWTDILTSSDEAKIHQLGKYLCMEAFVARKSYEVLQEKLVDTEMLTLYKDIEMPLSFVLYEMEQEGMAVNASALAAYGKELAEELAVLEKKIYEGAGREFNINSPKQLGEILFDEMKLPGGKKTKTGYSTSAEVLEKLAPECPMVNDILDYRTYSKLKSTYADGLSNYIGEDGRIHSSFNQTITATGRISSTEPNLQNIPMRIELGRKIRKVFIPKKGYKYADADYSQIELRILASMSGDQQLIEAYQSGDDIHRITASKVFHVPFEVVTDLQRRNAKAVNFGIVYGISSFGLSQDLSISKGEAKEYIEEYFATYPGIKEYLERCKSDAKEKGYSVTMFGRRRPIPELSSSNFMQRGFGERVAMNAPIQGTAADIMKLAMVNVFNRLVKENLKARLVLQVHDELIIEMPEEEEKLVLSILTEEMEGVTKLPVALDVEAHSGNNWYEAK